MRSIAFFLCFVLINLTSHADVVSFVIDGDTFITESGVKVRLLGINAPEKATDTYLAEPFSEEATELLKKLVLNKDVKLITHPQNTHDKYGRLLAYVYLQDGTWVNEALLKQGVVHIYTFPDTAHKTQRLFQAEHFARQSKLGIWQLERWQTHLASKPIADKYIGGFALVEGRVLHTAQVNDIVYLNFGTDWRNDFTVSIPKKYWKHFKRKGIDDIEQGYRSKHMIIRGFLKPVNGPMITASHPEQLQIKN
jgi:endonuclease YncB( thermonuclease family)